MLSCPYVEQWIRTRFGEPVIPCELDTAQIAGPGPLPAPGSALEEALREYNIWSPVIKKAMLLLQPGKRVYQMLPNQVGRGIITCAIPPSKYRFGLGWGFGDEFSVFDSAVVHDLGAYNTAIMYYKQARKVLSAHFEWQYDLERQELLITPSPQEALNLFYTYVDGHLLSEVPARHEDWILRFALLEAQTMAGNIRELLGSVQGNQTTMQLNGAALKAESNKDVKEEMRVELRRRIGDKFMLPLRDS